MATYKGIDGNNYYSPYVICANGVRVPPLEEQMIPGCIVKFLEAKEAGDDVARFEVIENRGDRVLVKDTRFQGSISWTFVYKISDLEIVTLITDK